MQESVTARDPLQTPAKSWGFFLPMTRWWTQPSATPAFISPNVAQFRICPKCGYRERPIGAVLSEVGRAT